MCITTFGIVGHLKFLNDYKLLTKSNSVRWLMGVGEGVVVDIGLLRVRFWHANCANWRIMSEISLSNLYARGP